MFGTKKELKKLNAEMDYCKTKLHEILFEVTLITREFELSNHNESVPNPNGTAENGATESSEPVEHYRNDSYYNIEQIRDEVRQSMEYFKARSDDRKNIRVHRNCTDEYVHDFAEATLALREIYTLVTNRSYTKEIKSVRLEEALDFIQSHPMAKTLELNVDAVRRGSFGTILNGIGYNFNRPSNTIYISVSQMRLNDYRELLKAVKKSLTEG